MTGESRNIVQSTIYNHKSQPDILSRLYTEGLTRLAQKKKAEEAAARLREEREANEN